MKKANKRILILLLCFALLVTMFTGCSTKSSTSSKADLAKEFLTEFFTINSKTRNDALMANFKNNSDIFTDESAFIDELKEYYSGVAKYLTDECLDKLIEERTMWKLDGIFLGAKSSWEISALDIQNASDTDSYNFNVELSSDEEIKKLSGSLSFTADNLISSVILDDYQEQFEQSNPNWAEGLEEYGVGYFIKPLDYQAAVVDYFSEEVWCLEKISSPIPVKKVIGYDDKTYDILFYDDFSNGSADVDPGKDVINFYGINGGIVPRWDCRYILYDLITEGIEEEGDVDTSVKPEVLGDFKVSDEVKEEIRQVYTKDWK